MKVFWVLLAALLPVPAAAQADYAMQWPLQLAREDGGAYRVQLDESVYRQLHSRDLRDLAVLNGDGVALPMAVLAAAPEHRTRQVPLPWFALPGGDGAAASDWQLLTQVDAEGRLRRVEMQGSGRDRPVGARTALLLDLGGLREPVTAIELEWAPLASLDLGYRVEASDDLEHWRPLPARGRLIDLRRDGHRLLQRRIELPGGTRARYLRLLPGRGDVPVEITGVEAVLAPEALPAPQWLELQPVAGDAPRTFEYRLDGRFPVRQVDAGLPGNHAVEWRLQSRDDADAPWHSRVGAWLGFRVETAGGGSRSDPRLLDTVVRDHHWRLQADGEIAGAPVLRLGYYPETVVFLAQGPAPYRLVAGSAGVAREPSPLPQLLAQMRERHGPDWRPVQARLGAPQTLAGAAALRPQRDWKAWLLWGVLGLGALLVAWLALAVLRNPHTPD